MVRDMWSLKLKHVVFSGALIAVNLVVFSSAAEAHEEGPKSCYTNGSGTCKCMSPHSFPTCSGAAECVEIFPGQCRTPME